MVFEQDVGADDGGFQARGFRGDWGCADCQRSGDQLVQLGGVGAGLDLLAQGRVAEQFGDLGQDLQVLLGGGLGHQQEDQQVDRLFVRGVEADRLGQLEHRGHRGLQALDAAVRDGHAVAQAGGAQALAGEQAVGDQRARQAVQVLEQQPGFLESALLAGGVDAHQHLSGGQDGREAVHGGFTDYAQLTVHSHQNAPADGRRTTPPTKNKAPIGRLLHHRLGLHHALGGVVVVVLQRVLCRPTCRSSLSTSSSRAAYRSSWELSANMSLPLT